ncbi:translation initiation factor IF-2 [Melioribacteraceae bacterium 4301-Me]|uniref:translation initiation factor IF-2 n=1 Tax=Pyranulibacter aquaticus TaxID=3163344 RepID=UPI003598CCB3
MSETTKEKKLRLYKFAAEVNLSTESLVEFLRKKGYDVKSHMSLLTDEMVAAIHAHFKKDIEKAEKHYKKISEFQKKRGELSEIEASVSQKTSEKIESAEKIDKTEQPQEKVLEVIEKEKEEKEPEEQKPVEVSSETTVEEARSFKTDSELKLAEKKKGLTIVGKIELEKREKEKTLEKPEEKVEKQIEEIKPEQLVKQQDTQPLTAEAEQDEGERKKKKKKKILKAKKKSKSIEEKDEANISKKKRKIKRLEIDKKEVDEAIKRTLLSMDESVIGERALIRKKKRKEKQIIQEKILEEKNKEKTTLKVTEYIAVNELANLMGVPVADVIQKCIGLGLMVSINQRLDVETITLVADEFGFNIELQEEYKSELENEAEEDEKMLQPRPPVVTIMGHVDHGKTSLLDYIRRSNVVAGEAGGITQHIGAYKVVLDDGKEITFLDTPGHEAFTAMRARGAKVTDIVVLVVAADDAVMPQTIEAINHAQAANVPIIVAINKIDKPGANPEKIRQQLSERNILVEDWGGKYQCVEISAKKGLNIDQLLEKIILEAEMLELKANPNRSARGTVIESQLDKGRGVTATVLVQKGTLRIGDPFIAGVSFGRVRAMLDERNNKVTEAKPSTPVLVLGFEGIPQAGDSFIVVNSERESREIALKRQQLKREQNHRQVRLITLDEIASQISKGGVKELPIIVKGDVDGSIEALSDSLMKLSNQEVIVRVIHKGVGAISEGDVLLAAASNAVIIGFHVRPNTNARKLAEAENVEIRLYNVIYDAINEVRSALEGMLSPVVSEELTGTLEVRQIFKVPKAGTVAGCYVQDGKISRTNKIRLFRDGIVIYEGELSSLKRFKDDVKEVDQGYECGLTISNFNDIKVGDIIESYKIVETKKKL